MQANALQPAEKAPVVFVVDDDLSVRESLQPLVESQGWDAKTFDSAHAFLAHEEQPRPSCLILDLGLPDLSGLDLQDLIAAKRTGMPIIFITGQGDIPSSVRAMKAGAVEFLTKPFHVDVLLDAVRAALDFSRRALADKVEQDALCGRYASLTNREREVMAKVVTGLLNKQIAFDLGLSEITVKVHRGRVMHKMGVRSVADLVKMSARLGDALEHSSSADVAPTGQPQQLHDQQQPAQ